MAAADRHDNYLAGGVKFVTSRILVVDMLLNQTPTHLITGILVCNAHRITAGGQEVRAAAARHHCLPPLLAPSL